MARPNSSTAAESIWYQDPRSFFRDDRLTRFVPLPHTPLANQLNAVMRLGIYYGALVFVFRRSIDSVYVPLTTAAVTYLVYTTEASREARAAEALSELLDVERDRNTGKPCTRPTLDNPYMNVLLSDYQRFPERPAACDITQAPVSKRADALYKHNLYSEADDVYDRNTGARQFYSTAATTIPNDQEAFARWLYDVGPRTCKEGSGPICATHIFKHVPGT